MSIKYLDAGKWFVFVRARIAGRIVGKKLTIEGTKTEARQAEISLIKDFESQRKAGQAQRSLKLQTFGDVLKFWQERTEAKLKTLQHEIDRLIEDLGNIRHSEILEAFSDFMHGLKSERAREREGVAERLMNQRRVLAGKEPIKREIGEILKPSTRNHYVVVAKTAYNFAIGSGKLKEMRESPLKNWKKETEEPRDRVWTEEERKVIFAVLEKRKSHLLMAVYFCAMNPIRRGDLINLTRANFSFNQFNPLASFVHFLPSKTRKKKRIEACLPCLDQRLVDYFNAMPADCPLLFPRFDADGRWHSLGDFKREWHAVLKEAGVKGLTWHDLKHCAITWMLDAGFKELDLRNLGIQYSPAMIERYYHNDAQKAMNTWQKIRESRSAVSPVIPACDPLASKVA